MCRKTAIVIVLIILAAASCTRGLGPRSISVDRTAYLEAVGNSWKEQILYNIVKLRYGDAPTFVDISRIQQSYQLETSGSAGYTYGWGKAPTLDQDRVRFWVPTAVTNSLTVGGGIRYQTNPSITYDPVTGEVLKNALMRPIQLTDLFSALSTGWDTKFVFPYCVSSINGLRNKPDNKKFHELVALWGELHKKGAIHITFEEVEEAQEVKEKEGAISAFKTKSVVPTLSKTKESSKGEGKKSEKEQKKFEGVFIILDKKRALDYEVKNLKELLSLDDTSDLGKKFRRLFEIEKTELTYHLKKRIREIAELSEGQIADNKDNILKVLEIASKELTHQEKERFLNCETGIQIEKYQVVSGIPPKEKALSKIYLNTRSVLQVLMELTRFIDIPVGHGDWVQKREEKWPENIKRLKVRSRPDVQLAPDAMEKPNEFAAVKYKGHWFYIPDSDLDSKDILSDMILIFTMIDTGKKEAPALTLPLR